MFIENLPQPSEAATLGLQGQVEGSPSLWSGAKRCCPSGGSLPSLVRPLPAARESVTLHPSGPSGLWACLIPGMPLASQQSLNPRRDTPTPAFTSAHAGRRGQWVWGAGASQQKFLPDSEMHFKHPSKISLQASVPLVTNLVTHPRDDFFLFPLTPVSWTLFPDQ